MASIERGDARLALAMAQKRFRSWREGRTRGQRIPRELWRAAMDLMGLYSLEQVAVSLALNEQRLAKHLARRQSERSEEPEMVSVHRGGFVDIGIPTDTYGAVCTIEAESAGGAKLLIRFNAAASQLATQIVKALWDRPE